MAVFVLFWPYRGKTNHPGHPGMKKLTRDPSDSLGICLPISHCSHHLNDPHKPCTLQVSPREQISASSPFGSLEILWGFYPFPPFYGNSGICMWGYDLGFLSQNLQFHKHLNLFCLALSLPPLIGWEKLALPNPIFFCNFLKTFFFPLDLYFETQNWRL